MDLSFGLRFPWCALSDASEEIQQHLHSIGLTTHKKIQLNDEN